jgi:tetratricopeptide (TPR) repeat protein
VADDSRIEDLERRVEQDPASIAFAQLGEEYRRAGRLDDAIRICRAGLARHRPYPSARVTLGRALLAQGLLEEARVELEGALTEAPDHIAAMRALEELRRVCPPDPIPAADDPALKQLESWLDAVRADRARRATMSTGMPGAVSG